MLFRSFRVFFAFWPRESWGDGEGAKLVFSLVPVFAQAKSLKCFEGAEKTSITLAVQAIN